MNSNQKKFKKEMEKGLKERNEEAYYKYIAQNNLDNPEQRLKYETKEKIKNVLKRVLFYTYSVYSIIL